MARQIGILLAIVLVLIIVGGAYVYQMYHATTTVVINGQAFTMQIANTDAERTQGLSGDAPLAPNSGMLFVFPQLGNYGFWMKDMNFPLDIIWVDDHFQVTHIEQSLATSTYPTIYYPDADSLYVLEVPAGTASRLDINVGDTIQLDMKTL
jgi:uncharacterized membrane protein (UPF0127 family)